MEERVSLIRWIKENKKELMYAGLSVAALILLVLGIKHRDAIKAVWESLTNALKGPPVSTTNQAPVRMADIATTTTAGISPEPIQVAMNTVSNSDCFPFEVRGHIRNLPNGWHASPGKLQEALVNDIVLSDGQTWVGSYLKGGVSI